MWRLPRGESSFVTLVIPELFRRASLLETIRSPRALLLKLRLLSEPGVVVADVPALAGESRGAPERAVVRVLVSSVNATSMRAVNYARTLGVADTRAVSFAFSPEEGDALRQRWLAQGAQIPLEIDDAPYRDIGTPLLSYLRRLTDDESTEVIVVMPELVVRGARRLLHNQTSSVSQASASLRAPRDPFSVPSPTDPLGRVGSVDRHDALRRRRCAGSARAGVRLAGVPVPASGPSVRCIDSIDRSPAGRAEFVPRSALISGSPIVGARAEDKLVQACASRHARAPMDILEERTLGWARVLSPDACS